MPYRRYHDDCIYYGKREPGEPRFNFGKYKGRKVRVIYGRDPEYIHWILKGGPRRLIDPTHMYDRDDTYADEQPCFVNRTALMVLATIVLEEDPDSLDEVDLDALIEKGDWDDEED